MPGNSRLLSAVVTLAVSLSLGPRAITAAPAASEQGKEGGAETVVNPGPDVRIELKVMRAPVKQGDKNAAPIVVAELINREKVPVLVVKPGDGSESGRRTPLITWRINDQKPGGVGLCGNINALCASEVVELKPGERLKLDEWLGVPTLTAHKPGVYRLSVEYDHRPDLKWGGIPLGTHDPKTMERIRASKPIKAKSNVVEIRVEE